MDSKYIRDFNNYSRREADRVLIGSLPLGSDFPVRIQSMTNTHTADVDATADQIIRLREAGADYVRVTVPSVNDAEKLKDIMKILRDQNCQVPVIADIHFNPKLALMSAPLVQKVRINPGNFAGKLVAHSGDHGEQPEDVKKKVLELIDVCRKYKTALRIGTNHGSLSPRIMDLYGDTPLGMVESVMEFLRICVDADFREVVVSIKASNTRIMVYATRLLVKMMALEDMNFPVHLGVTEAGEGEDGRIKSAVGMGALMVDGIGDTIRVSLTEDPVAEIPVAKKLVQYITVREKHKIIPAFGDIPIDPYSYSRRSTIPVSGVGGHHMPVVVFNFRDDFSEEVLNKIGWLTENKGENISPDILVTSDSSRAISIHEGKQVAVYNEGAARLPLLSWDQYAGPVKNETVPKMVLIRASLLDHEKINYLGKDHGVIIVLESDNVNANADLRAAVFRLINTGIKNPVIFRLMIDKPDTESFQIAAAAEAGGLFIDGLGDGLWLENAIHISAQDIISTAFGILQAARVRMSKTEYISCPSCGRTLFDIQDTIRRVKEQTAHLKKLKIGIMGCIVNGPGEMADADYGYIGSGTRKITLYKGKGIVKRNVPEAQAVSELIKIIKENGDWTEP